jgi:hypothetical protein
MGRTGPQHSGGKFHLTELILKKSISRKTGIK